MITDHAERPAGIGVRRTLARWNVELQGIGSPILRYGFSVVSVALGLGLSLIFQHYGVQNVESPPFSLAIVFTAWYAGIGPSVAAVVLSATCFNYFFSEPLYTFEVTSEDLPNFLLFTVWAIITAGVRICSTPHRERSSPGTRPPAG